MKAIIPLLVLVTGSSIALAQETQSPAAAVETETPQQEGITGVAHALNGNTILLDGRTLTLFAISIPALREPGGYDARAVVDDVLTTHGSEVTCLPVRAQTRSSPYALCTSGGVDLGEAVIKAGWARVARRTLLNSDVEPAVVASYRTAEADARAAGLGVWAQPVDRWWESWWFEIVKTLLTVAGAVFGFWLAAGFNFRRNRDLQEHARESEAHALAAALEVELQMTVNRISRLVDHLKTNRLGPYDRLFWRTISVMEFRDLEVLKANYSRLSYLDPLLVIRLLGADAGYGRFKAAASTLNTEPTNPIGIIDEIVTISEMIMQDLKESADDLARFSGVPDEYLSERDSGQSPRNAGVDP